MQSRLTLPILLFIPAFLSAGSTSVTLTSSANPTLYGHAVTLTAVVSPSSATGTVTFSDGVTMLEAEPLSGGQATFTTVLLDFGSNSLTAYYGGDGNDAPSKSAVLVQKVNATAGDGFQAAVGYPGGNGLLAVAVGDFNGDGKVDLATIGSTLNVLLGNGDGTFQPVTSYVVASNQNPSIAVGDFNGDGNPDLATPTSFEGIAVLLGHGDGTFQPATYWFGDYPNSLVIADFNGDGKADLAFGDGEGGVVTLLGNGDGTFSQSFKYETPSDPVIAVGDFNGDGKPDLAFSNQVSGYAGILLGNGDGTFTAGGLYTDGTNLNGWASVAVGDFNGDGKADIAVIESGSNTVNVFLGNGDGTLQAPLSFGAGTKPISVAVGDFNGDGKPDLAVANHSSDSVSVLFGNGDGTFQTAMAYGVGSAPEYAAVADYNGDGIADLATVSETSGNTLEVLLAAAAVNSTETALGASPNPSTYGETVTLTATVTPSTVTGTVTFNHGSTSLGTSQLSNGIATLKTSTLSVGSHSLTATYEGGSGFTGSTSPAVIQVVSPLSTTTNLTSSPNPSIYGRNVTLTATVSPSTATGAVTFYHGPTSLGTGTLTNGVATLVLATLSLGSHSLTATYGGDADDAASTSKALIQVVQNTTATILTSAPNPSVSGQKVTFTATVTPATATGTVTFYHGSTVLGTGTLTGGIATYKTTSLAVGTHSLTATYGGDADDEASTSPVTYQVVNKSQ